jgi:hypothetical protein
MLNVIAHKEIANVMGEQLRDWVDAEHARVWPSAALRAFYRNKFAEFATWANRYNLDSLPADAYTIAAYLCEMKQDGETIDRIKQMARAIVFCHDLTENFLDRVVIAAALRYCEQD